MPHRPDSRRQRPKQCKYISKLGGLEEEEFMDQAKRRIAIGRMAQGEDIANVICFLVFPLNTYMVGQALPVEGGKEFTGETYLIYSRK